MTAFLRAGATFVNVAIFLLAASSLARILLLLSTVAAWWFLSDYFFAPWPWWMDRFAFMVCSLVLFLAMTAAVLWLGIRPRSRKDKPAFDLLSGSASHARLPIMDWCRLFEAVADLHHGIWKSYWKWYSVRLKRIAARGPSASVHELPTLWWFHRRAIPQWMALGCLPALWVVLVLTPLHSNVMENVAAFTRSRPAIYNVRCSSSAPPVNGEDLLRTDFGFERKQICGQATGGAFEVSSTPFPRVYRRIAVRCLTNCSLVSPNHTADVLDETVAVVGSDAKFQWVQTGLHKLEMTIFLQRQDGTPLNTVTVEPSKGD
jgi:hypothetical protein